MGVLLIGLAPEELNPATLEQIRALAPDLRVVVTRERAEIEALLDSIEIAAATLPRDLVARAPRLRWFQQWAAGADWLMRYPEAVERDFILTSASGVHAIPISEYIIGVLLMFGRGLHSAARAQVGRVWRHGLDEQTFELAGKTMLLVGVGAIGARTAALASALGMRVEGVRRDPTRAEAGVAAMYGPAQLRERLPHADVLVLTVPLSRETRGMIGEAELRAMRPGAYLVNVGRGGTLDEPALVRALRERWIAGAALDVFAEEPLPEGSPLWSMEQVIISPHISGGTPLYNQRALAIFLDNLRRFRVGEPLRNVVDKRAGY